MSENTQVYRVHFTLRLEGYVTVEAGSPDVAAVYARSINKDVLRQECYDGRVEITSVEEAVNEDAHYTIYHKREESRS